jgi:hypothetical protein
MFQIQRSKLFLTAATFAVVAGLIYNSWPLGYILNPLASRRGLASELAALHQPYNWLFVLLDVLAGLLIVAAAVLLWRRSQKLLHKIALVNFAIFGIMTAVGALVPMSCEPSLTTCPSLSHDPLLIVHGITSISASVCLFVSVCLVWWQKRQQKGAAVMSTLLAGWTLFGLVSVYFLFMPGPGYIAQHYYITLCSVWIMVLPFMLDVKSVPSGSIR